MSRVHRFVGRLALAAGVLFVAGRLSRSARDERRPDDRSGTPGVHDGPKARPAAADRRTRRPAFRRVAATFLFVLLFSTGAAVSALAGDVLVEAVEGTVETTTDTGSGTTDATTTDATDTTTAEAPPPEPPPSDTSTEAAPESPPPPAPPPPSPSDPGDPSSGAEPSGPQPAPPVLAPKKLKPLPPELTSSAAGTVWLHRTLPDPTPPAKRLSPAFALRLRAAAHASRVRWTLVLAVLRARGHDGRVPADSATLRALAARLADAGGRASPWRAALALGGGPAFADRVLALARYNRAVGLQALVTGLAAAKPRLEAKILRDERIDLYTSGRGDIASGRVDIRVLVLIRYMRVIYGQVTVSSLRTGHAFFARPGVPSAHVFGLAVDISALAGVPIAGHQEPGGLTERAVKDILLLPVEIQPQQVISLLGLSGPSFPLADHYDHIHVGF